LHLPLDMKSVKFILYIFFLLSVLFISSKIPSYAIESDFRSSFDRNPYRSIDDNLSITPILSLSPSNPIDITAKPRITTRTIPTLRPIPSIGSIIKRITPSVLPSINPTAIPTSAGNEVVKLYPRIFYLVFNPVLEHKGGKKLVEYMSWNDPYILADSAISDLKTSSHGIVNYSIYKSLEIDGIPLKVDGFQYTDQTYLDVAEGRVSPHEPDTADYQKILIDYHICDLVNEGKIDELWMMGAPWFGFFEANMTGPGSFWTNGPIIDQTSCNKAIHIMGFAYQVGHDMMLEDYGHRSEGAFNIFIGNYPQSPWSSYQTTYALNPHLSVYGCGNVHAPPNATDGYDRSNSSRYVVSNCDDWLNYPNFRGEKKMMNCSEWGCTTLGYLNWWFFHLPHVSGVDSYGKFQNWWNYVVYSKLL
jgi:hypothetical protein